MQCRHHTGRYWTSILQSILYEAFNFCKISSKVIWAALCECHMLIKTQHSYACKLRRLWIVPLILWLTTIEFLTTPSLSPPFNDNIIMLVMKYYRWSSVGIMQEMRCFYHESQFIILHGPIGHLLRGLYTSSASYVAHNKNVLFVTYYYKLIWKLCWTEAVYTQLMDRD